jgi:alkylation response protein AidB-like acyl-CoA dehydrogenase
MSDYRAPVKDMGFVINELAGLADIAALPGYEEATPDLIDAVLEEAAVLSSEVIAPTNVIGDEQGTKVVDGQVIVPQEFHAAYQQYVEGGWSTIVNDPEYGGQGLPKLVGVAVEEMLQTANLAWSLCPMLTQGAIHAVEAHCSDALKAVFLEPMISGAWTGTMNLTESNAGSDLSVVRSTATPNGDAYKVTGQKIFITWGDHDVTDNIVHLVIARTPDAPEGVKGLSLFLVPKFLVNEDGSIGERNSVTTASIEHKLGIHGSPTCVLDFQDAEGYLIGELGHGLACMFTMMNSARLGVGLEGVSISERAYQHALAYSLDRVQGRAPGHEGSVAIVEHPDVRRMLLTMKAETEAMRALTYVAAGHLDRASHMEDAEQKAFQQARVDLLIPVVKGWITENAQVLTSLGVQVHGGMGYVEETGAAQFMRDARILTIYEGTTGIQAGDLIGRKILRDGGAALTTMLLEIDAIASEAASAGEELGCIGGALSEAVAVVRESLEWLLANYKADPNNAAAVSYHFLMMLGTVAGGWQMARAALVAKAKLDGGAADKDFYNAKILTARFYAEQALPRALGHAKTIQAGGATMMAITLDQLRGE